MTAVNSTPVNQRAATRAGRGEVGVLVIGAGQAGLGTGYWLSRRSEHSFLIVDGASQLGQSWTDRWDSLRLFTPRGFSRLPGLPFPAGPGDYPSKSEVAAYLQSYAARFALPVQLDTRVEVLAASGRGFVASTTQGQIRARHVVVATGPFHGAYVPDAATGLGSNVGQLHSVDYRRPADIDAPDVLVVGGGNSAAQLACELAPTHRVTMASPRRPWFLPQVIAGVGLYRWLRLSGTLAAKSDARVSRYIRGRGDPIIGRELADRVNSGQIKLLPHRVTAGNGDTLTLQDGSRITTSAVLWCTGFRPDYEWVQLSAALDADGLPIHHRGASPVAGLHWMGLPWQTRLNSSLVDGVDRDARDLVARLHG